MLLSLKMKKQIILALALLVTSFSFSQKDELKDAEKAHQNLSTVLKKSTSFNLFGQHPPFQMDANFGVTAGIAEMLIQSHQGIIELLPALPKEWPDGEVKGLRARGGFEVDMKWQSGNLISANVKSILGNKSVLRYRGKNIETDIKKGESQKFDFN